MGQIFRKLVGCIVLLGLLTINANCYCADRENASDYAVSDDHHSDPCADEPSGHDQDHPHNDSCQCGPKFIYASERAPSFDFKHTPVPPLLALFDPRGLQTLLSVIQSTANAFAAHSPPALSAATSLLRLHCALTV
jgi:hypothetical protein